MSRAGTKWLCAPCCELSVVASSGLLCALCVLACAVFVFLAPVVSVSVHCRRRVLSPGPRGVLLRSQCAPCHCALCREYRMYYYYYYYYGVVGARVSGVRRARSSRLSSGLALALAPFSAPSVIHNTSPTQRSAVLPFFMSVGPPLYYDLNNNNNEVEVENSPNAHPNHRIKFL